MSILLNKILLFNKIEPSFAVIMPVSKLINVDFPEPLFR